MKKRTHQYNLVEIILALGVVVIGVVSIMGLFPIGTTATRDAAMEMYASTVADEMLQFMKYRLTLVEDVSDEAKWKDMDTRWKNLVGKSGKISGTVKKDKDNVKRSELDEPKKWIATTDLFGEYLGNQNAILQDKDDSQLFQLIAHHAASGDSFGDDEFTKKVDFRAIATLWKEQILLDPTAGLKIPYENGVRLVVNVSWPAELPYETRQKATYALEIYKPVQP